MGDIDSVVVRRRGKQQLPPPHLQAGFAATGNRIGISIRVAHYPPHCSKYNPIEHRLFPHITRAWSGVIFRSMEIVTNCLKRVWTNRGLKLTYARLEKAYQLQRQISASFLESYPIQFAKRLPDWNYTVVPTTY